ncbi:MAG: hypothetical protein N2C14_23960, partial [Planctomycetales bacterium]
MNSPSRLIFQDRAGKPAEVARLHVKDVKDAANVKDAAKRPSWRQVPRTLAVLCGVCFSLGLIDSSSSILAADPTTEANDRLWKSAEQAYRAKHFDAGHGRLRSLMDDNP